MKLKISILIAGVAMAFASCLQNEIVYDTDNLNYRTIKFAGPIAKIHVPLYKTIEAIQREEDFLESGKLSVNNNGVICISYKGSASDNWNNKIGIRNHSANWPITITDGSIADALTSVPLASALDSEVSDSYVDEALLTSGKISFMPSITGGLSGNVVITIPELTKGGVAFTQTISLSSSVTHEYPLTGGYRISTDNHHFLTVQFTGNVSGSGVLDINFNLSDVEVDYVSGYFGQIEKETSVDVVFDFFDELDFDGTVGIRDIILDAAVTHWVGLPTDVEGSAFFFYDEGLSDKLEFNPDIAFYVAEAMESSDHIVVTPAINTFTTALSEVEFTDGNYPDKMTVKVNESGNPQNYPIKNFAKKMDDEFLSEVDLTVTIPLYFKASTFRRVEWIDFDYNDIINDDKELSESINNLTLYLAIANTLPFEVLLSAYATDDAGNKVGETIMLDRKITMHPDFQDYSVTIDQTQLEEFRTGNVKNILLDISAATLNEEYVQVKEDAFFDVNISVSLKSKIPSTIFE
jgi:hypothetical protein